MGTDARLAEKRGLVTPSFQGTCTPCLLPVRLVHQSLHHYDHHQDHPHLHPRAAYRTVDAGKHVLLEKRKQPGAGLLVGIEMLEAQQQRRNVVPGLQVDPNVLDPDLTEFHLWIAGVSHDAALRRISEIDLIQGHQT